MNSNAAFDMSIVLFSRKQALIGLYKYKEQLGSFYNGDELELI